MRTGRKVGVIIVDNQNDFNPGGSLPAASGDAVQTSIRLLIRLALISAFRGMIGLLALLQDWHPAGHGSFASSGPGRTLFGAGKLEATEGVFLDQTWWPDHCVQGTKGAELRADMMPAVADVLASEVPVSVIRKGMDPNVDSYSGFFDNGKIHATTLEAELENAGIGTLLFAGFVTEVCVKACVIHALELGYKVIVVKDACASLSPEGGEKALEEMEVAGALILSLKQVANDPTLCHRFS